jgi:hypothetical protein
VGLEVEFNGAAAGHADVAFEAPVDEAWLRGGGGEEFLRKSDSLRFDATAADASAVPEFCDELNPPAQNDISRVGTPSTGNSIVPDLFTQYVDV